MRVTAAVGPSQWRVAVAAGIVLGAAYALSPLTVLTLATLPLFWRWVSRDLSERERYWLAVVLCAALTVRLIAIGGLFLTAHSSVPFANFFGDEEFFKRRSVWMRNIGLGVPIAGSDVIYAYDDVGRSLHLYVLAYLQAIVGNAPYGILMLNAAVYAAGALAMYRLVRPVFGGVAALGGLALLLFLPSLLTWSISALKEPSYMCVAALEVVLATALIRARRLWTRPLAGAAIVACAFVLQGLRDGGMAMAVIGVGGGLAAAFVVTRPRLLLAGLVTVPLVAVIAFNRPEVQLRAWSAVHEAAYKNWGYINTPGYTYRLLDERFYQHRSNVPTMTPPEAVRFVASAAVSYVTVPLPWRIESRAALAFLPEQMVWYGLIALVPLGIWAGLRRDAAITSLLIAHAAAAALMVALTGGNVGTLVRHRGLALPYLVWLSALGGVEAARILIARARAAEVSAALPTKAW